MSSIAVGLPALAWAFPVVAILYFRVWPAPLDRRATRWTIIAPFVSIVVPMTLIVGVVYEYDLITAVVLGLFAVAFAVEVMMFWWAIGERDGPASPNDGLLEEQRSKT